MSSPGPAAALSLCRSRGRGDRNTRGGARQAARFGPRPFPLWSHAGRFCFPCSIAELCRTSGIILVRLLRVMRTRKFWVPVIASLTLTPIALLLGVGSAGAGHGDYRLPMILFPYTLLSTALFDSITPPFIILAVVQFPLYGVALGYANEKGRLVSAATLLFVAHGIALTAMLLLANDSFP